MALGSHQLHKREEQLKKLNERNSETSPFDISESLDESQENLNSPSHRCSKILKSIPMKTSLISQNQSFVPRKESGLTSIGDERSIPYSPARTRRPHDKVSTT